MKRYVDEEGRAKVQQLLRRHQCVTSALLPVEFRSALRRRVSDGSFEARRVQEIWKRFATDREFWALIEVTDEVLQAAEGLVAAHPLRTLDAIHLASAELFMDRLRASNLAFVSADRRQSAVAAIVGMAPEEVGS